MALSTKRRLISFNPPFVGAAIVLFVLLLLIALYVNDSFVRPLLGDVLVVVWLYCTLRACVNIHHHALAAFSLLFAYLVELGQYFNLVTVLGLDHNRIAKVVLGATFDWRDILAYTCGWLALEGLYLLTKKKRTARS